MAGAMKVLNEADTALVGGHTSEGAELAMGFAVNGLADPARLLRKGGMRPGDRLILTKPLGTGTLFAADMRRQGQGALDRRRARLDAAIQPRRRALPARAWRDRLHRRDRLRLARASGGDDPGRPVSMSNFRSAALPLLDGALDTVRLGILSSLQPQNVRLRRAMRGTEAFAEDVRLPLIFDPQTAGGLLTSVPGAQADACLAALRGCGYAAAAIIGTVLPRSEYSEHIVLRQ